MMPGVASVMVAAMVAWWGLGPVEGVDLERGVDACADVVGDIGEQGGGVGQFVDQGRVFGGRRGGGEGV